MKKRSILIADDDDDFLNLLCGIFEKNDYIVYTACNGPVALETYDRYRPQIVLLDISMPGKTGTEVAKIIRKSNSSALIVIMTGFMLEEKDSLESYQSGVNLFIRKPITHRELFACVNSMMETLYGPIDEIYEFGDFVLNMASHTLSFKSMEYKLTEKETKTLQLLTKRKNMLVPTKELINYAWQASSDEMHTQMLRNTIADLKKKILCTESYLTIESVYGKGYVLKINEKTDIPNI